MTATASQRTRLTRTRVMAGIWEGVLTCAGDAPPAIVVTHLAVPVAGHEVTRHAAGEWLVRIPIPAALISEGIQTFVISEAPTGEVLDSFVIIAGSAMDEDIRAEVDLLRAELDLLKRAFRRFAVTSMG